MPPQKHSSASPKVTLEVKIPTPGERCREPVTCGVPWPRGVLRDVASLVLQDEEGGGIPLQTRILDRWPDGSIRWVLLDWQATVSGPARYHLTTVTESGAPTPFPGGGVRISAGGDGATVETGVARFEFRTGGRFPFEGVVANGLPLIDPDRTRFSVEDEAGHFYQPYCAQLAVEDTGPLRGSLRLEGALVSDGGRPGARFMARIHFFAGSAVVRLVFTLHNPQKAGHPVGLWDLGNPGSIYIRDASLHLALPTATEAAVLGCSPEGNVPFEHCAHGLTLYQDSSGGANWKSSNHVNRNRIVPNTFCGYQLSLDGNTRTGRRATPVVTLDRGQHTLALGMQYFWQNFPKAVEASPEGLTLRLFPRQYADVHEIQGGEQKTHIFSVAFGRDTVTALPLAWCRSPLLAHASPSWYCSTGVFPYLIPKDEDPNAEYVRLSSAAVDGEDTFERKREVIDEYGWRHFGDIYGDHEAVFHQGPAPLVSHYNNQYDAVAGFAYQFCRSGDARWWRCMDELAWHVIDIDIYHTDQDKSAYNHGLFWHTFHYVDADTGTHRSYPRALGRRGGGGPGDEQNYATGLMLHHYLTGNPASREAAVGLARWVIDMDDGRKTVFRWLDWGYTGAASASRTPSYHGPGRGGANSVAALLDGHRLTRDVTFLAKAEQLIRRCIHPADDVVARDLLDAENRWFYTMFLQSLGRYLDYKAELGQLDYFYAYARASLLHYARWMAGHEYPYLDKPERLEYPTETWAAQDMRKSEVFKYAAKHASGEDKARFLERAEFFFRYATTALSGMKTRTLARPVVLLLSYGFMHAYFQQHRDEAAPPPAQEYQDFGKPEVFVPQKVRAKKWFVQAAGTVAAAGLVGLGLLLVYLFR